MASMSSLPMRQGAVDTLRAGFAAGSSLANDAAAKHPVESMQLNVSAARSFSFLLSRLAARRRPSPSPR